MTVHPHLNAAAVARLVGDEMALYHAALGTHAERLFYFDGQDPLAFDSPAQAIAGLYESLAPAARESLVQGLMDLLAARLTQLPVAALVQLVLAIGLIGRSDLLDPLVRVLAGRTDDMEQLRDLQVTLLSVVKGFGGRSAAVQAARDLAGLGARFPDDLVYDLLEVLLLDTQAPWADSVADLQERMGRDYRPSEYARIKQRLHWTALDISRLPIARVADGLAALLELLGDELEELIVARHLPRRDPLGMLIEALVLDPNAPFRLVAGTRQTVKLATQDGRATVRLTGGAPLARLVSSRSVPAPDPPRALMLQAA